MSVWNFYNYILVSVFYFLTITVRIDIPYIKKNVIGGTVDIIWWADDSFRMDITPGSFKKGNKIDILVSTRHSHQYMIP